MSHTKSILHLFLTLGCSTILAPVAYANNLPVPFEKLAKDCAPNIHVETLKALITVESSGNPYAIGVVNGALDRQPKSLPEAVATARKLEKDGFNFSMGLSQVNRHNLSKYGETYESVFEPCRNLKTGAAILTDCYTRASIRSKEEQAALRAALSCYYSGNFSRGFKPDALGQPSYVQKVVDASTKNAQPLIPQIKASGAESDAISVRPLAPNSTRESAGKEQGPWVIFSQPNTNSSADVAPTTKAESNTVKAQIKPSNPKTHQEVPFVQFHGVNINDNDL